MQTPLPYVSIPTRPQTPVDTQQTLIQALASMPLASTHELTAATGRSPYTIRHLLRPLAQQHYILQSTIGATLVPTRRLWLAPNAFAQFDVPVHFYNTRRGMGILAARIYAVERIYQLAQDLDLLRPDYQFQWHSHRPYDAAAGRPEHWTAIFWIGIWEDKNAIRRRIIRLGHEVESIWPYLMAFAVPDRWQAHILHEVLDELHLTPHAAILVADDNTWSLPPPAQPPRDSAGWPEPPSEHAPPKLTSGQEVHEFLLEQQYTGSVGALIQKINSILEQWPGILTTHIRSLLQNKATGSQISVAIFNMQRLELAISDGRSYYPGPKTWTRAAHRDRVPHRRTSGRLDPSTPVPSRRRVRTHEWTTTRIAAHFQNQGCDIAPGWRAVDDAGPAGKVDPDAIVYLHTSPYGPGWHYLEYERRAKTSAAIAHKLRSYFMPQRSNDWPVMFVVANEEAERLYWQHGHGLKLITAIDNGANPPTKWRCFGVAVHID